MSAGVRDEPAGPGTGGSAPRPIKVRLGASPLCVARHSGTANSINRADGQCKAIATGAIVHLPAGARRRLLSSAEVNAAGSKRHRGRVFPGLRPATARSRDSVLHVEVAPGCCH